MIHGFSEALGSSDCQQLGIHSEYMCMHTAWVMIVHIAMLYGAWMNGVRWRTLGS